jgi:hypothetical protein
MSAKVLIRSLSLIALIFVSQQATASSDSGTLTPGTFTFTCPFHIGHFNQVGFGGTFGVYSPIGLTGGKTVGEIFDEAPAGCGLNVSFFSVTGFSSDPGTAWLTSVTCNGITNARSAAVYQYSGGTAQWFWFQKFGLSNGSQVSCTIIHN